MLNRAVLILRYKEPAVRWINEADPYPDGGEVTVEGANRECTVYLISDEVADTPQKLRMWVQDNFRMLFESELEGWYTEPALWPQPLTMKLFDAWFSVECHSMVFDTVGGPIVDDEI